MYLDYLPSAQKVLQSLTESNSTLIDMNMWEANPVASVVATAAITK
jgi:hypothetical protein